MISPCKSFCAFSAANASLKQVYYPAIVFDLFIFLSHTWTSRPPPLSSFLPFFPPSFSLASMNSRVLLAEAVKWICGSWKKVRIECSTSCLPCWWACYYIDPVKCLWNAFPPTTIALSPSLCVCVCVFLPNIFPHFLSSFHLLLPPHLLTTLLLVSMSP